VLEHNLYRIAQQAITNAVTHGHASRILIGLSHADQRLRLSIIDNGIGLDATASRPPPGMGLKIMRYRCSVLGLALRIESPPGGGTAIVVEQSASKD
jgi:signal transduction histidine kinase